MAMSSGGPLAPGPITATEALRASAQKHGARLALRGDKSSPSYTYAQLLQAVEDLAAGLARLGVQPGDRVALMVENSPEWVLSWLGIVRARGIVVPIYYMNAPAEVENLVRQSGSRFAIATARYADKFDPRPLQRVLVVHGEAPAKLGAKALPLAEVSLRLTAEDRARVPVEPDGDDLATIIYTSGTTGDPKGVMLTHRNVLTNAAGGGQVVGITHADRLLVVLPLHHVFPLTAAFLAPLIAGAEMAFETDLRRIRDRMAEISPTMFFGVPALFSQMYRAIVGKIEADGKLAKFRKGEAISRAVKRRTGVNVGPAIFKELHAKFGGQLRFFGSAGAAIAPDLIQKYALLGIPLIQGWGMTEAAPALTLQHFSKSQFLFTHFYERNAGSVGRPMPGVELATIDVSDKGIFSSLHGEGELIGRGVNIMQGYYKNEAATSEVMIGEWLRTGDIGTIAPDGQVRITGRAKSVIVLDSGEKVYPDEVEERFQASPLVRDICVLARRSERQTGERRLQVCAVVYPDPTMLHQLARDSGERLTHEAVRRWVEREVDAIHADLAPFKRIVEVILTDQPLPRTDKRTVRRGLVGEQQSFDIDRLLGAGALG